MTYFLKVQDVRSKVQIQRLQINRGKGKEATSLKFLDAYGSLKKLPDDTDCDGQILDIMLSKTIFAPNLPTLCFCY